MLSSALFRRRAGGGLSDEEAERRIQKMIAFILNDAREKAEEIALQAEREADELRRRIQQEQESASAAARTRPLTASCAQVCCRCCRLQSRPTR